jgi:hypothetical protein
MNRSTGYEALASRHYVSIRNRVVPLVEKLLVAGLACIANLEHRVALLNRTIDVCCRLRDKARTDLAVTPVQSKS